MRDLPSGTVTFLFTDIDREAHDPVLADARRRLGEEGFAQVIAEAQTAPLERVITYALEGN